MKKITLLLSFMSTVMAGLAQVPVDNSADVPLYSAAPGEPTLFGNVIDSQQKTEIGMNSFTLDGQFSLLANQAQNNLYPTPYAGIRVGDFYYSMRIQRIMGFSAKYLGKYDINRAWTRLSSETPDGWSDFATLLAEDPTTNKIYGVMFTADGTGYTFGTYDLNTARGTAIAALDSDWAALSFDANGQAFAIDWNGDLLKVNKETGETSIVGSTGVSLNPDLAGGGIIDQTTGVFYWTPTLSDGGARLYKVNLRTAEAELINTFANSRQICGLYIEPGETSGINNVTTVDGATVRAKNGVIEVLDAVGNEVVVIAADGRKVAAFAGSEYATVDAASGLYIVKVGKEAKKIIVK